ncbi:MAG TPA: hypothetical protein VN397_01595 [Candidatus Methylomirabilis sp.]|nr:hypothetical protein [Candidatus Methylomirabilis sp.]
MPTKPEFPRVIYILIVLGALAPFIIAYLSFLFWYYMHFPRLKFEPAIGTYGATCGGPSRLPCEPGLICSVSSGDWTTSTGTCIPDSREIYPPGQSDALCDTERGCAPGLLCEHIGASATGTCQSVATSTPPAR